MASKLGPHVLRTTDAARKWAAVAPIVKAVDNVGILQSAPASAIRVFRHYFATQNLDDFGGASLAIETALAGYRHPNLYVEVWNEVHPTAKQLRNVTTALHGAGLKVAGGSYGTGDFNSTDLDNVRLAGCDALALHAYWGDHGFSPWNALRYRSYGTPLPILLTECGRDAVEGGKAGWKNNDLTAGQYAAELLAYDAEISKDADVLGACVFSAGPTPDWDAFDTDSLVPLLIASHPKEIPMPIIGAGFDKCIPIIGAFVEDETYHGYATPSETSLALAKNGYAVWHESTNETIAYKSDGAMWADGGNHGDGSMKQVRAPFR